MLRLNLVVKVRHGVYAAAVNNQAKTMDLMDLTKPVDLMNPVELVDFKYLWS